MTKKLLFTVFLSFLATGCGTIMNGRQSMVNFSTIPDGVTVHADGQQCITPCQLKLPNNIKHVYLEKDGYVPKEIKPDSEISKWVMANFLVPGSVIAFLIDARTGGGVTLHDVDAYLDPVPLYSVADRNSSSGHGGASPLFR